MSGLLRQIFSKLSKSTSVNAAFKSTPSVFSTNARFYSNVPAPHEIVDPKETEKLTKEIVQKVNNLVATKCPLFAVVHVAGKQFKITEGDLIIIEGYWPPDVGDKISLDKVLTVGSKEFSLIGRPLVQHGLVDVHATVIEKGISHTKTHFRKKRRKQYKRINFFRVQQTMLRINRVAIKGEVNKPPEVTGLDHAIF